MDTIIKNYIDPLILTQDHFIHSLKFADPSAGEYTEHEASQLQTQTSWGVRSYLMPLEQSKI